MTTTRTAPNWSRWRGGGPPRSTAGRYPRPSPAGQRSWGDTPLDVAAALSAGARAVGVATGSYASADLLAAGAHAVLPSLADTSLVLDTLLG